MRAIVYKGPRKVILEEIDEEIQNKNEALIEAIGIGQTAVTSLDLLHQEGIAIWVGNA